MTRIERFHLCRSLLLWATAALAVNGFVNVPQVRKPMLQSTSTSVTYEPAFVFTDTFRRNPFTNEQQQQQQEEETPSSSSSASAQIAFDERLPPNSQGAAASLPPSPAADNNPLLAGWGWLRQQYLESERARRSAQTQLRVALHHFIRDSGTLRSVMDFLVTIGTPSLALDNPDIVPRFLQLTQNCIRIPYGKHALQGIDMYLPNKQEEPPKGLLFFVVSVFLYCIVWEFATLDFPSHLACFFFGYIISMEVPGAPDCPGCIDFVRNPSWTKEWP